MDNLILQKKTKKNVERIIEGNVVNESIEKEMKHHIDIMEENNSHYRVAGSIRQQLKGKSSIPRNWFQDKLSEDGIIINSRETNYGDITVASVISNSSSCNYIVSNALNRIGYNTDTIIENTTVNMEYVLEVDTGGLKFAGSQDVSNALKKLKKLLEIEDLDSDDDAYITNFIALRYALLRKIYPNCQKYVYHYNRVKEIFENASCEGTFPRQYEYKGVIIGWNNIIKSKSLYCKTVEYFKKYDINNKTDKSTEFICKMMEARVELKKHTLIYKLDDYDYLQDIPPVITPSMGRVSYTPQHNN